MENFCFDGLRRWRRPTVWLVGLAALAIVVARAQKEPADWHDRDAWENPARVLNALDVKEGSRVADVGCGRGYFTVRLAQRVGASGKVFAEDISYKALDEVNDLKRQWHLAQIELIQGTEDDPQLPAGQLDAILIVDAYHEMKHYQAMLSGMAKALKPGGLLGIVDHSARPGQPRAKYEDEHRIAPELVREECLHNGFEFVREEQGFNRPKGHGGGHFFFLIFRKPL